MNVPKEAYDLARTFEGLRLEAYHDSAGYPTIAYGHLLSRKKWEDLRNYPAITEAEAETLLTKDLEKAAESVIRLCPAPLTDRQFAALIDFTFNLGAGNLQASTLRHLVNRGEMDEAAEQFGRWVYAGGVKLPGLVHRRQAERDLWIAG